MKISLSVFVCEIHLLKMISNQFNFLLFDNYKMDVLSIPKQLWLWLLNYHLSSVWICNNKHVWRSSVEHGQQDLLKSLCFSKLSQCKFMDLVFTHHILQSRYFFPRYKYVKSVNSLLRKNLKSERFKWIPKSYLWLWKTF